MSRHDLESALPPFKFRRVAVLAIAIASAAAGGAHAAEGSAAVRLYAIDCGRIQVSDMGAFADTGELDGREVPVVAPCFLVRHPKGTLLWDTGLPDQLAGKGPVKNGIFELSVKAPIADQLAQIGLTPAAVDLLAFSHMHFDHTGKANAFPGATWILNKDELAYATAQPAPLGVDATTFSAHAAATTRMIAGDHDVFGDGTVQILKSPGHTPGHGVLLVKLRKAGYVVLSGDLFHLRENREHRRVPALNVSRADTLASIDRIEKIAGNRKARFVVQHDVQDFESLPRFPAYLE
jgi:glyoxylase-like metal-dependent hydrolase (beta-lactamase superfamily II)